ncbi:MAG: diguanylate cyclase [Armatimonadetes bacterium]|nr:diguanylate cyclase [Armatimonadota bacterium]
MSEVGAPLVLVVDSDSVVRAMLCDLLAAQDLHEFVGDPAAAASVVAVGDQASPAALAGRLGQSPECVLLRDAVSPDEMAELLASGVSHVLPRTSPPALIVAAVSRARHVAQLRADADRAAQAQRTLVMESLAAATENIGLVGALEAVLRAACVVLSPVRCALWLAGRDGEMAPITLGASHAPSPGHEAVARLAQETSAPARGVTAGKLFEAHPIVLDERCEGALCLEYEATGDRPADADDTETIAVIAGHAAGAIRRDRLFADLRSSSVTIQSLFEVGLAMASETSPQRLFEVIVDSASRICGAERCSLMVRERHVAVLRMRASRGIPSNVARSAQVTVGEGIAGSVAESGEALFIADIEADLRFGRPNAQQYRSSSLVCVPVRLRDGVAGVLCVTNKTDGSAFTANDLNLMTLLASQAAVAIDNAERYQDLNERAITDGLTGVYLRRYFDECLAKATETASAGARGFVLLMVDVDHFKKVNDNYGHPVGDIVLRGVAARLKAAVRDDDLVARYGGEEFAVILSLGDVEKAKVVAERVRSSVAESPIHADHHDIAVTVSVGMAAYEAGLDDPGMVVTVADAALYRAKSMGRNRVVYAPFEE